MKKCDACNNLYDIIFIHILQIIINVLLIKTNLPKYFYLLYSLFKINSRKLYLLKIKNTSSFLQKKIKLFIF